MDKSLQELIAHGKSLGYTDKELQEFVKEQEDFLRDERAAARQTEKDELQYKLQMQEMANAHELKMLEKQQELKSNHSKDSDELVKAKAPKLPCFDDNKDDMDSYLRRFERYAEVQHWHVDNWASHLSALLKGRALDVYALLPSDEASNYKALKTALLKRYDLTEDGFKLKFRSCRPESCETFLQFSVRLSSCFQRWFEMSKCTKSFEGLIDLMLRDQFLHVCNRDLALFLKERIPNSLTEMATLADQFREARFAKASSLIRVPQPIPKPISNVGAKPKCDEPKGPLSGKGSFVPKSKRRCYKCSRLGHIASECKGKLNAVLLDDGDSSSVLSDSDDTNVKGCSALIIPVDTMVYSSPWTKDSTTTLSSSCQSRYGPDMPVASGFVEGKPVSVLRDTGCSGIVIRRSKVPDKNLTGKTQVFILADGSSITVPIASITVDTPYLSGTFDAWCMEAPVYDLILGNVSKVRPPEDPDLNWTPVQAVETRQQAKLKGKPYPKLVVPKIVQDDISPDELREAQQQDDSLSKIRDHAGRFETFHKKNGSVKWLTKNGLLYREYSTTDGKVYSQLVVPAPFRTVVMKLAHGSVMSGHLATRCTVARVISEFYLPGVQSDIRRFCQSCDVCQRTIPKGRVTRVPLESMPFIEKLFHRVAVDLIGPLHPVTDKGNRYILTLVDYATRYPEAVALPSIETERVAEALVDIFSRVGVPHEMLSDMGAQFISGLMSEVSRLISLKQLTTTPYHPMCNGLCERFNGTLKQMIKRMCAERPRDWDKYLNSALFAYREVPQENLGFSPFELVYGRSVRGPMTIFKELWTNEIKDPEIKSTYQYVIDLREKLEYTCKMARENLEKASKRYRGYYNLKTKPRNMSVGDKVLVLLPTDNNKLLLQWKGPYKIIKKVNKVDYQIEINGKVRCYHANLLKLYVERETSESVDTVSCVNGVFSVVSTTVIDCSSEDQGHIHELPMVHGNESTSNVDICHDLLPVEYTQVCEIMTTFPDVLTDTPGHTTILHHDIQLVSSILFRTKPRPIPYTMFDTVNEEVSIMLDLNIIEPSKSPFCSPIVIVKKKDASNRFCIDFRALNNHTVFDAEPMPITDEIFSKLATNKIFSKLDLSKGYWQVPLSESSKPLTAFQSPKGLFQFRVMPFGLVTASATFSRLMRILLQGLDNVENFIEDILIFTQSLDHHLQVLKEVLRRLRGARLTAKPSKCSIAYQKVECLGHIVGDENLSPNPDKVTAISNADRPETKKQLRSFLGLIGFYRKFVPNFALVAVSLTDMTRRGCPNKLVWSDSAITAFHTLKQALIKFPILKFPNMSESFVLQTDASDRGIGTVLLQEEQGKKLPVASASRKLKGSEVSYATVEKECLAIVWAVQKFQCYLYGNEFMLETDHKPLVYLNRSKVTNARLMRWALSLQPYRYRIVAIKGRDNVGADYLSRL